VLEQAAEKRVMDLLGRRRAAIAARDILVGKHRFHNARLHGIGVLCGLRVDQYINQGSVNPGPSTVLRVTRGAALDSCGPERQLSVGLRQAIEGLALQKPRTIRRAPLAAGRTDRESECDEENKSKTARAGKGGAFHKGPVFRDQTPNTSSLSQNSWKPQGAPRTSYPNGRFALMRFTSVL
jgi:hypothetical protein